MTALNNYRLMAQIMEWQDTLLIVDEHGKCKEKRFTIKSYHRTDTPILRYQ